MTDIGGASGASSLSGSCSLPAKTFDLLFEKAPDHRHSRYTPQRLVSDEIEGLAGMGVDDLPCLAFQAESAQPL